MPSPTSDQSVRRFRFLFPLLAILLGITLGLAGVELAFRAAGFTVGLLQSPHETPLLSFSPDEFRIVCLGESTTDDFGAPDTNWCGMLSKKLNAAGLGRKIVTINRGRTSAMTTFLVDRMISELETLKPDLVISMMGINDTSTFEYLHPTRGDSLRLIKVGRWLFQSFTSPPPQRNETEDIEFRRKVRDDFTRASEGPLSSMAQIQDFRAHVFDLARSSGDRKWIVYNEGSRAFQTIIRRVDVTHEISGVSVEALRLAQVCAELADLAYRLKPTDRLVLQMVFFAGYRTPGFALPRLKRAVELGYPLDDEIASFLAVSGAERDAEVISLLKEHGYAPSPTGKTWFEITAANYRRLAETLRSHRIEYMAMQYPTGKIDVLRFMFSDREKTGISGGFIRALYEEWGDVSVEPAYGDVIFASNENFDSVVTRENEKDYFVDLFSSYAGGRFGHATTLGHELIARNAADTIIRNWPQISK